MHPGASCCIWLQIQIITVLTQYMMKLQTTGSNMNTVSHWDRGLRRYRTGWWRILSLRTFTATLYTAGSPFRFSDKTYAWYHDTWFRNTGWYLRKTCFACVWLYMLGINCDPLVAMTDIPSVQPERQLLRILDLLGRKLNSNRMKFWSISSAMEALKRRSSFNNIFPPSKTWCVLTSGTP